MSSCRATNAKLEWVGDDLCAPEDRLLVRHFAWVETALNRAFELGEARAREQVDRDIGGLRRRIEGLEEAGPLLRIARACEAIAKTEADLAAYIAERDAKLDERHRCQREEDLKKDEEWRAGQVAALARSATKPDPFPQTQRPLRPAVPKWSELEDGDVLEEIGGDARITVIGAPVAVVNYVRITAIVRGDAAFVDKSGVTSFEVIDPWSYITDPTAKTPWQGRRCWRRAPRLEAAPSAEGRLREWVAEQRRLYAQDPVGSDQSWVLAVEHVASILGDAQ